jgi:hypothetical protein
MSRRRDYQAEEGYQPDWHLQREKQEKAAEEYYERVDRKDAERRRQHG